MKVLITGGTGTVGKALISQQDNEYISISRNEENIANLRRLYPEVKCYVGNIEDKSLLLRVFKEVKPDVVVHAAAMKHIDLMETNPIAGCNVNVIGSLNVAEASIINDVPITIGISTDKACLPESVYGASKYIMERVFLNTNTDENRFALTRFANVAHSAGSVLPFWLKLKEAGFTRKNSGGFVKSYKMKCVNMLDLAKVISDKIEIVGKRPGEKTDEDLISEREIKKTYIYGNDIHIRMEDNEEDNRLYEAYNSATAERMTNIEMMEMVWNEEV